MKVGDNMHRLINSGYLIEGVEGQNITYTLMAQNLFFDIGYKVLQSQAKYGYINCNITTHNGKQKLIYNVSGLKSFDVLMKNISPKLFLNIFCNLLDVVINVKNNGFMQCENISLDFRRIFVDTNNMKVWLIYVPLNIQSDPNSYVYFETQLKKRIVDAIDNTPILNQDVHMKRIRNSMAEGILSIEQVRTIAIECMGNVEAGGYSVKLSEPLISGMEMLEKSMVTPVVPDKKAVAISQVQKQQIVTTQSSSISQENRTTTRKICLKRTNAQEPLIFTIEKDEYLIGKQKEAVDGYVPNNTAISRIHCKVIYRTGEFYIVDMGSTNGTYLNRNRLQPNCPTGLHLNDRIMVADCEFIVASIS